jgi:hypothetical protein
MPLYVVSLAEDGGYSCQCRMRAAATADHIDLAVRKIWGAHAFWAPQSGAELVGRVYERIGDPAELDCDHPRTALTTVQIAPAHRRRYVS